MESYILDDDDVGQRFAAALIAKQQAGVQVNLIRDSVGTLGTATAFFTRLSEAGVQIVEFNPVNPLTAKAGWEVNQRDHRKLLIIDGRIAFLGGINISSVYSGSSSQLGKTAEPTNALPWRDTDLRIEGPVVGELQKMFIITWAKQRGPPLAARHYFPPAQVRGSEVVRAIGSSPDDPYSLIYVTLISALRSAQREIWLTNAYFVPDPQLLATLKDAVARSVDVRLILPSSTDSWLVFHAGRAYYDELLQAGVRLYERHDALLHVKTAVIDGVWSTVGSTNLDWRSFLHNQEVNAVVLGSGFGDKMRAAFRADLAKSREITLDVWQVRARCAQPRAVRTTLGILVVSLLRLFCLLLGCSPLGLLQASDAPALCARYQALTEQLAHNLFQRPLYLESKQSDSQLQGDIYAEVEQPFSVAGPALQGIEQWCELLILHLNVRVVRLPTRRCRPC